MTLNPHARRLARRAARLTFAAALLAGAACSDFLVAENPGAIPEEDLTDPGYIGLLTNTGQMAFQTSQDDQLYWNGQLTDEIINRNGPNPFAEEGLIDRRDLNPDMTYITAFIYSPMQRARFLAEDAAARLKIIYADSANREVRIARNLAYAGYAYTLLGESMCVTPIDRSVPLTSDQMFDSARTRFDEAIATATAARTYQQGLPVPSTGIIAQADSIRNFALVGAGRAALNQGDWSAAIAYAAQVPTTFMWRENYDRNTTAQQHRIWDRLGSGNGVGTLVGTRFEAMATDPRVPRRTTPAGANGTPLSPSSYSTFNNTAGNGGGLFDRTMSQRIASYLEAQYIIAEASLAGGTGTGAMTEAQVLAFVNQRRQAGAQTPVTLTGVALRNELIDQRSRDFYLDGHRLGDLRRYLEHYSLDLFPTGTNPQGGSYSDDTCWPLPTSELNDNPNV